MRRWTFGRKPKKPTLSQLDLDNTDDYEIMQSGSRNAAQGAHRPDKVNDESRLRTMGTPTVCWCGGPLNHDWPGKNDGTPHPR